jgi:predicted phage terminase large subunit-like protein
MNILQNKTVRGFGNAYYPEYKRPKHVEYFEKIVKKLTFEKTLRYIIEVPPRHGKSVLFSVILPAFYIVNNPNKKILLASYAYDLAGEFAYKVRTLLKNNRLIDFTIEKLDNWETVEGGGLFSAGVGGSITGKGASLLILDDPIKNMEEARSKHIRDKTYEWFNSTFLTRAEPDANIVVIQTRWHSDDLVGRLVKEKKEKWEVIKLPAFAEEGDVLGRTIGEPLWPERFPKEELENKKKAMGSYVWNALYQQNPISEEACLFKSSYFKYFESKDGKYFTEEEALKDFDFIFGTLDLAVTEKQTSHYTAIGIWGKVREKVLLLNVTRERMEAPEILKTIQSIYYKFRPNMFYIESFAYQVSITQQVLDMNIPVTPSYLKGDKYSKALSVIPFFEQGRIYFDRNAGYLQDYEEELLEFPNGNFDDQVDMTSLIIEAISSEAMIAPKPKGT